MSLKLVCMSDLHLGAKESLLSHFNEQGRVAEEPGTVLKAFAEALRATIAHISPDAPARLVFLGDALDLGLSPLGNVSRNMLHMLNCLFPSEKKGETAPFDGNLVYIPGNHDHHVWRMAQDAQYVTLVKDASEPIKDDILQVSPLAAEPSFRCRLVSALMQRVPALEGAGCNAAYPNWAVFDASGKRAVVLHHGHYVDPMYMALSRFAQWLSGSTQGPKNIVDIERENGPWIDFLWSDLGSAGSIGRGADTLYDTMLDAEASHEFAGMLSDRIGTALASTLGIPPDSPLPYNLTPRRLIGAAVDMTAGRTAQSQRDGYRDVLSSDEVASLKWYLGNPVAQQFKDEVGEVPEEIGFIFGHTHKAFQDQIMVPAFPTPTRIFNTGGWVLDEPTLMPCQGAAVVLVDDDLNLVSLRLFNDVTHLPVTAEGIGGFSDAANPLLASAQAAVRANAEAWSKFSEAARAAIEAQAEQRVRKITRKLELESSAGVAA